MDTNKYITDLGEYLSKITKQGKLSLHGKNTINYDTLFEEIYRFVMETKRKDLKEPPGDRATALKMACESLIKIIETENQ